MAQTFGAVAHGLATYRPGLPFAGVLANRVGSAFHARRQVRGGRHRNLVEPSIVDLGERGFVHVEAG